MDQVIAKIEDARAAGLKITADMYTYTAGATGLDAVDAAVGARRRLRRRLQAARGPGDAQEDRRTRSGRRPTTGRTCTSPPARRTACCSSSSSPTR